MATNPPTHNDMVLARTAIAGVFSATAEGGNAATDMAWIIARAIKRNGYLLVRIAPDDAEVK